MQIVKQKRTYWRVEPGSTTLAYATLELTSAYDNAGKWQHGWHVRIRASNGLVIGHGGVYQKRNDAVVAACAAPELQG